jgi:hypothetical protein
MASVLPFADDLITALYKVLGECSATDLYTRYHDGAIAKP